MRGLFVDGAAYRLSSAEYLLYGASKGLGKALVPHCSSNRNALLHIEVAVVCNVLLLLPVTSGLLKGLDDEGRGRGNDGDGSLSILYGELNGDAKTLPVGGCLGDVLSDLLG